MSSRSRPVMLSLFPFRRLAFPAVALAVGATISADRAPSRKDADHFLRKVTFINQNGSAARPAPRRTPVTEGEVNSYLLIHARSEIPAGVVEPYVTIVGDGRLAGRAIVDLDGVRRERSSGRLLDPMSYLTGRLPVTARGVLRTSKGVARFQLESAEASGISIPKIVLQELLSYYSRSPEHPRGLNLDDPFELPAKIREIEIGRGQAIVVQ